MLVVVRLWIGVHHFGGLRSLPHFAFFILFFSFSTFFNFSFRHFGHRHLRRLRPIMTMTSLTGIYVSWFGYGCMLLLPLHYAHLGVQKYLLRGREDCVCLGHVLRSCL